MSEGGVNQNKENNQMNNNSTDDLPSAVSLHDWTIPQAMSNMVGEKEVKINASPRAEVEPKQKPSELAPLQQVSSDLYASPFLDASPFTSAGVEATAVKADYEEEDVPEWYFSKELKDEDIVELIVEGETAEEMFVVGKDGKKEKLTSYESAHDLSKHIVRWKSGKAVTVPEELRKDDNYQPRAHETEDDKVQADDVRFLLPRQLLFSESLDLGDYNLALPPVSTLGPKPKPMSLPQQVQEEIHDTPSSPSVVSNRESLTAEQALQATLNASGSPAPGIPIQAVQTNKGVMINPLTEASAALASMPLQQQIALLEQYQNLNIGSLLQQNNQQPSLTSTNFNSNQQSGGAGGYFTEDDMMKRIDSLGLQGYTWDAVIAAAEQQVQQQQLQNVGLSTGMQRSEPMYDLSKSPRGATQILGSMNNKQLNQYLDSMAIHQNLDVSQYFQGQNQQEQIKQSINNSLLSGVNSFAANEQTRGQGQRTPRSPSPLSDEKDVEKRTSYFFVAHSRRQMPEASDEETRRLFQLQLEQKKPMLAPWYRTSPRGGEDEREEGLDGALPYARSAVPSTIDGGGRSTPPRVPLPKLDDYVPPAQQPTPFSAPPPTSLPPQVYPPQQVQWQQQQRQGTKSPIRMAQSSTSQSGSSSQPKKGSGVFIPKGSGVFIPGVTKLNK
eukprot:TRINITY_DN347_c0_g1_i1.p1 TRINITY_DN347_c0_g1~~TRINITY_DN347_c0_g1_i1.p1  ORF type:complete len:668 (-),score=138.41 TRINITY_DN347_c0_g1_i1:1115-3118(-)